MPDNDRHDPQSPCDTLEEAMKSHLFLPFLLFATGLFVTVVHDYAYRRTGGDDFEFYGLVSHAGADMIITSFAISVVALLWSVARNGRNGGGPS